MVSNWIRARFKANFDDSRPIKWPPPGPFWETGISANGEYSTVVAYVKSFEQVSEFWPEAKDIDSSNVDEIVFTERFQRPDWYLNDHPTS